jgi:predicted RNA-binding protein YlqC (UPF0109 family)
LPLCHLLLLLLLLLFSYFSALQLSADDKFGSYMDLTLQLANTQGLIPAVRTSTARSVLANAKAQLLMALQDEDVGAVLGKKGQTLTQIQQVGTVWTSVMVVQDSAAAAPVCVFNSAGQDLPDADADTAGGCKEGGMYVADVQQ